MIKFKRKFKEWLFKEEISNSEHLLTRATKEYEEMSKKMKDVLGVIEVAVDVHEYHSESWE